MTRRYSPIWFYECPSCSSMLKRRVIPRQRTVWTCTHKECPFRKSTSVYELHEVPAWAVVIPRDDRWTAYVDALP